MSYVAVYGSMHDNKSARIAHTSSRRGNVTRVLGDVNTHFGKVLNFEVYSEGENHQQSESACEQKIIEWTEKGNERWIKHYKDKLGRVKIHNHEQKNTNFVNLDIRLKFLDESTNTVNGTHISPESLYLLDLINSKSWVKLIEKLKEVNGGIDVYCNAIADRI